MLQPIWNKLVDDTDDVDFVSVDIDDDPNTASKYSVSAVPTILFIKDGVVVDSLIGLHKEADIRSSVDKLVKKG
jgi:thioredoxin 1